MYINIGKVERREICVDVEDKLGIEMEGEVSKVCVNKWMKQ